MRDLLFAASRFLQRQLGVDYFVRRAKMSRLQASFPASRSLIFVFPLFPRARFYTIRRTGIAVAADVASLTCHQMHVRSGRAE